MELKIALFLAFLSVMLIQGMHCRPTYPVLNRYHGAYFKRLSARPWRLGCCPPPNLPLRKRYCATLVPMRRLLDFSNLQPLGLNLYKFVLCLFSVSCRCHHSDLYRCVDWTRSLCQFGYVETDDPCTDLGYKCCRAVFNKGECKFCALANL